MKRGMTFPHIRMLICTVLLCLPSLAMSSCGCVPLGACHHQLSSPPALPSGETCLPSWEPCCLPPRTSPQSTVAVDRSPPGTNSKLSCLPADLCHHLGSPLPTSSCPNPGHVHCLLSSTAVLPDSDSQSSPLSELTTFDPSANQYLIVVPCMNRCPGPTFAKPELFPPCRSGLKRCLLTLDLALLFAANPIVKQHAPAPNIPIGKTFTRDLPASGIGFKSHDFSFAKVTTRTSSTPGPVPASFNIFSTKSFQSFTTPPPNIQPPAWPNHQSDESEETKLVREQPAGSARSSLHLTSKIDDQHQVKNGPVLNSKFAFPRKSRKGTLKETSAEYLQDLPEEELVTVLEALKEAIAEVDVA